MLFNGNRFTPYGIFSPSKLKVKTSGSTQSSDYYKTKTMVVWKTYWANLDSTVL